MDLNHIELSADIITELYKNHLIAEVPDEKTPQAKTTVQKPLFFVGENHKNVAIVIDRPLKELTEESHNFLKKLMNASSLQMEDIALINRNENPGLSFHQLDNDLKSRIILLLGVEPKSIQLPLHFPHFQVQPFHGITYLFSPPLDDLVEDQILKRKLWDCLKRIFNLT